MGILDKLPPAIVASLTQEQADAIRLHLCMRYETEHTLDVRRAIHFFGRQFYIVLLAGAARRSGP